MRYMGSTSSDRSFAYKTNGPFNGPKDRIGRSFQCWIDDWIGFEGCSG